MLGCLSVHPTEYCLIDTILALPVINRQSSATLAARASTPVIVWDVKFDSLK